MYQLQARACQTKSGVYVTLAGFLVNSCMQVEISGTYPGSIVHFVDPGHGEIFIDEKQRPGSQICLMHLVPWYAQAMLPGSTHKTVVIYVNGKKSLTVPVADEAALKRVDSGKEWIVTALAGAPKDGPFLDCATHHRTISSSRSTQGCSVRIHARPATNSAGRIAPACDARRHR